MDFFGIGIPEAIFFILIMLIILGPADMVKVGRSLGTSLRKLWTSPTWRMIFTTSGKLRNLPNTLVREAGLEEMRQQLKRETDIIKKIGKEVTDGTQINPSLAAQKQTPPQRIGDDEFPAWTTPPDEVENTIAPPSLTQKKPAPTEDINRGSDDSPPPTGS